MKRVAKFEKVSDTMFFKGAEGTDDINSANFREVYDAIKLPKRATAYSAGYDFYAPYAFTLEPGETIKIPTGIRCKMDEDYALFIFPRSGLGFKYRLQLNNTIGVVDADYYGSSNEGHIFIKLTNDSNEGQILKVQAGDAFAQGIFLQYGITEDDDAQGVRDGGFGSTSK